MVMEKIKSLIIGAGLGFVTWRKGASENLYYTVVRDTQPDLVYYLSVQGNNPARPVLVLMRREDAKLQALAKLEIDVINGALRHGTAWSTLRNRLLQESFGETLDIMKEFLKGLRTSTVSYTTKGFEQTLGEFDKMISGQNVLVD